MKAVSHLGLALALAAGTVHADSLALVAADSSANETAAQQALVKTAKFTSVDIFDTQSSIPTLAALSTYTHVLAWTAAAPADRVALGNLLADFYDLGGKHLTVATYGFSTIQPVAPFFLPDPEIQGRVAAPPYAAFTNLGIVGDVSGALVAAVPSDAVFAGIDLSAVFYAENQYFAHPGLATGATLLAADGAGPTSVAMIARSQNGVINVNFYPGGPQGSTAGNNSPALFDLITNTFPAGQIVKDTVPPATTSSIQPAPNAKGWNNADVTVVLTASDNAGGSGVKQISIALAGAQTGNNVVAGNTAPVSVTAEGSTALTYFSTDNAGNVESAKNLSVLLDKTPPSVTASLNPLPDASGKNTTPVTVTFTGTDTLSGIASCTPPVTLTASGTAKGTCTDNAGNSTSASKIVTIVAAPPGGSGTDPAGPLIRGIPSACVLHPAGDELVPAAALSVDATKTISFDVTASSNQPPANGKKDIVILGTGLHPRLVLLRAERPSNGTDRIYTVTAKATGTSGQTTVSSFTCTVARANVDSGHGQGGDDRADQDSDHDGPHDHSHR